MRGLVWHGPNQLSVEKLPDLAARDGESLVRVTATGICGSDIHGYTGASGRRTPGMVMGHEFGGVVESSTEGFGSGRRVAVNPLMSCGGCVYCRDGEPQVCPDRRVIGVNTGALGGFAEYVAVPSANLVPVSDQLSDAEAAMAEPLAVAVRAVNLSGLHEGEPTLVMGAGTIGLCVLLACRARGIGPVYISDRVEHRLEIAARLGGEAVHADSDPAAKVLQDTGSIGARATLDAVGIGPTITQSLRATRRGGSVVLVGLAAPSVDLALYELVPQERALRGSYAYTPDEYRDAVRLIEEQAVDVRPLIERTVTLDEAPAAFAELASGRDPSVKVIVEP